MTSISTQSAEHRPDLRRFLELAKKGNDPLIHKNPELARLWNDGLYRHFSNLQRIINAPQNQNIFDELLVVAGLFKPTVNEPGFILRSNDALAELIKALEKINKRFEEIDEIKEFERELRELSRLEASK